MKKLLAAIFPFLLVSCAEDVAEDATINYYFLIPPSTEYDELQFHFDYTRAIRVLDESQVEVRSVYLDPVHISTSLDQGRTVDLGASTIEPENITGYDFGFSGFVLIKDGDTLSLTEPYYHDNFSEADITPAPGETMSVTFVLDTDASSIMDSAGESYFKPEISIKR